MTEISEISYRKYYSYLKIKYAYSQKIVPWWCYLTIHVLKKILTLGSFPHTYKYEVKGNKIAQIYPKKKTIIISDFTKQSYDIGDLYLDSNKHFKFFKYTK